MLKTCISKDWKFKTDATDYVHIDLPHDYAVALPRSADCNGSSSNGFFPNVMGRYVKYLHFGQKKRYILHLDGAYMNAQVTFNENHLARHPYGYTPYLVDLTDHIIGGTNKLVITTNPLPDTTRWYSGSGLYRDVFLWEGGDIRIEPWDMFISTISADEHSAQIRLKYTVTSDKKANVAVRFRVEQNGNTVLTDEVSLSVRKNRQTECEHMLTLESPLLWNVGEPNLYTLHTEIFEGDTLVDASENEFGVRTITADAENGLRINGRPVKLRGGCIHHDHAVLGAAAFPAAEERKLRLLKEAGFNAVRTAHNPPSLALLECADRLGMVVMDEAFDSWNKHKCVNDYSLFFAEWCMRDISYMIKRDRNHPCVMSYSIGNEILEIDGTSDAYGWAKRLADEMRKYDDTKFITSGIQKGFAHRRAEEDDPEDYKAHVEKTHSLPTQADINRVTDGYEQALDIIGCNYYYTNYEFDHECNPNRVLWGSETHAIYFYDSWQQVKKHPYVLGDFTWTAYDNLGEVGTGRFAWERDGVIHGISLADYPWRSCYQGDLDLCGYRRPQSYFREAVWLGNTEPRIFVTHPEHFGEGFSGTIWHWYDVNETWTFDDVYVGRPVKAETYTDADRIVWYVNDTLVGESVPEKGVATIETVYQKGAITAVAFKGGAECGRYTLRTTGSAAAIDVAAEKAQFAADNRDLCYFDISIVDSEGRIVNEAQHELTCTVMGGELLGIFSGDPCNEDQYTSNRCHAFKGRALAIVRTKNPGAVGIKVYCEGLAAGYASSEAI
ncbi:MAG: hypothetical protein IJC54_02995 [Clostridia bacterium]|nr:hypothetical protein [Clostridia bacterium]MBQ4085522.1 hypothetical protein [Clostridia bacterium]